MYENGGKIRKSMIVLAAVAVLMLMPAVIEANENTFSGSKGAVSFFGFGESIYKMNTNTGSCYKIKTFSNMNVYEVERYGAYLYFTGNRYEGSDGEELYVYRMHTNGTGLKRLGAGRSPIVWRNSIYYVRGVIGKHSNGESYTSQLGIGKMSLTGGNKKTIISKRDGYCSLSMTRVGMKIFYYKNNSGLYYYSLTAKRSSFVTSGITGLASNYSSVYGTDGSTVWKISPSGKKTRIFSGNNVRLAGLKNGYLYYSVGTWSSSQFMRINVLSKKKQRLSYGNFTQIKCGTGKYVFTTGSMTSRSSAWGLYTMTVTGSNSKLIYSAHAA